MKEAFNITANMRNGFRKETRLCVLYIFFTSYFDLIKKKHFLFLIDNLFIFINNRNEWFLNKNVIFKIKKNVNGVYISSCESVRLWN